MDFTFVNDYIKSNQTSNYFDKYFSVIYKKTLMNSKINRSLKILFLLPSFFFTNYLSAFIDCTDVYLGVDTSFCVGDTLILTPQFLGAVDTLSFLWSTGDTTETIEITESGIFSVTVSSQNTTCSDTINVFEKLTPLARFELATTNTCIDNPILLINQTTQIDDNVTYSINWGNNQEVEIDSNFNQLSFNYTQPGSYGIFLQVKNGNECFDTTMLKDVNVFDNPMASLNIDDSSVCLGESININNISSNLTDTVIFKIDYGDNNRVVLDTFINIHYQYLFDGDFEIVFVVENQTGCTDTISQGIFVAPVPTVSFTGLNIDYCENDPIDTLIGNPIGGQFRGQFTTSTNDFGIFNPSSPKENIPISYSFTNEFGCSSIDTQIVDNIYALTPLSFELESFYCLGDPIDTIVANVEGGRFFGNIVIGNNDSFALINPDSPGFFEIEYEYTNENGCTSSLAKSTNIFELPIVDLGNDTSFVFGEEFLVLSNRINEPSYSYFWSTGAQTTTLEINNPGFYVLEITDTNTGCIASDTLLVDFANNNWNLAPLNDPITLYPNPSNEQVTLKIPAHIVEKDPSKIFIFDLNGRIIFETFVSTSKKQIDLNLTGIPPGIYILNIGNHYIKVSRQ